MLNYPEHWRITSDMSNPAPRAVMEKMASDFDAMHPNLNVELTVIDREGLEDTDPKLSFSKCTRCCELVRSNKNETIR